ncbi:ABC transporter substrate-binding protein [Streptomyces mirabilis]|uniref:ABC transporter substrate-binding protein n=1 Tax=Streptomyces mirabilis TaxID=68239 RepID=UPI00369463F6
MAYARGLHISSALVMCGLLLVGCTGGENGGDTETGAASDARTGGDVSPTASPTTETDPAKQPRTADQARALIGKVIAGPELFGPGVVRTTPYESDPSRWAVLGDGCTWHLAELPAGGKVGLYARVVPAAAPDASVVIADMLAHNIDGFFCTGTPERAATVARALAERGFAGPRFLDAPTATASFITAAGDAADGWQTLTPYISPDATPVHAFATAYRKRYGSAPGIWAPEAYDTARLVADRLTALAGEGVRRPSRAQVTQALTKARFKGLTTTYAFDKSKELTMQLVHHYRVDGGRFAYVGMLPTS